MKITYFYYLYYFFFPLLIKMSSPNLHSAFKVKHCWTKRIPSPVILWTMALWLEGKVSVPPAHARAMSAPICSTLLFVPPWYEFSLCHKRNFLLFAFVEWQWSVVIKRGWLSLVIPPKHVGNNLCLISIACLFGKQSVLEFFSQHDLIAMLCNELMLSVCSYPICLLILFTFPNQRTYLKQENMRWDLSGKWPHTYLK